MAFHVQRKSKEAPLLKESPTMSTLYPLQPSILRTGFISLLALLASAGLATAQCTAGPTNQTVTICAPASGATNLTSPVNVVATTTDSNTVTLLQIYLDGVAVYHTASKSLNTNVTMAAGTHRLTVQATDSTKTVFKTTENVTVGSGSGGRLRFGYSPQAHHFHGRGEPVV